MAEVEKVVKWEKMSKSRGNVVSPEEVVFGAYFMADGYEFRDLNGQLVDWNESGVWLDKLRSGCYFTSTRAGRQPVFLHQIDNPIPCVMFHRGKEILQHEDQLPFWKAQLTTQGLWP